MFSYFSDIDFGPDRTGGMIKTYPKQQGRELDNINRLSFKRIWILFKEYVSMFLEVWTNMLYHIKNTTVI